MLQHDTADPTLGLSQARAQATDTSIPERIGRYAILGELGRGGMGILTLEEHDGVPFLTMEIVDGANLRTRLKDGPLPVGESVTTARQVASALEAAHARGIVHRDVKPANVMVTPAGVVKVLDLGVARALWGEESWGDDAAQDNGAIAGTPGYISPEQLSGGGTSELVDVWALGCLLYECLTGCQAFAGDTPAETLKSTLEREPRLDLLPDDTPPELRALLAQCLDKNPQNRPRSMAEVRRALGAIADAMNIETPAGASQISSNLPRRLTTFIGRENELIELRAHLEKRRIVVLTGPGGSGKTRLSLELAEAVLPEFPSGVAQVELASVRNASVVPKTVAAALGVEVPEGTTPTEAIVRHLRDAWFLLILDNCEHLRDACAALTDAIINGSISVWVLATSREPLGIPGEIVYAVPPLAVDATGDGGPSDAERLFIDRARAVRPDWTPDDDMTADTKTDTVREICRRLDGIPLAIELAAARMRTLTLDELRAGLDRSLGLLAGGAHSTLPRHETLRGVIDWSYAQLTEEERVVFRRVACCPAGLTPEAAAAIVGAAGTADGSGVAIDVPAILTRLVERSLLAPDTEAGRRAEETRYRMLATVREYAWERLASAGEATPVRTRQLTYYLELLKSLRADPSNKARSLARVDVDHDNVLDAIQWDDGDTDTNAAAMRLAIEMSAYWNVRNLSALAIPLYAALYDRPLGSDPENLRALIAAAAGRHAFRNNDYATARPHFERFLAHADEIDNPKQQAEALSCLGLVETDPVSARDHFERALAIQREIGDAFGEHLTHVYLGTLAYMNDDIPRARELFEASIRLFEALPTERRAVINRIMVRLELARVDLAEGDTASAREQLDRVIEYTRGDQQWTLLAGALGVLGDLERAEGNVDAARRVYHESLTLRRERGGTDVLGDVMRGVAMLEETDDPERCLRILGASDRYRRQGIDERKSHHAEQARLIERLRDRLGADAFERASAEGTVMSRVEAVDYIVAAASPPRSPGRSPDTRPG